MKKEQLPKFFNFKEEDTNNGYECIQDFYLSWTIRCANRNYKDVNPLLYEYSRKIVFAMIYGINNESNEFVVTKKITDDFHIIDTKTIRQHGYVDLVAILDVEEFGKPTRYVLNIEDKFYTKISDTQLAKSKEYVQVNYITKDTIQRDLVIFCDFEHPDSEIEKCKKDNYTFIVIEDLQYFAGMKENHENTIPTGNDLFDEYWFKF